MKKYIIQALCYIDKKTNKFDCQFYYKHSASPKLSYEQQDWRNNVLNKYLTPIELNNWKIGTTICHDMFFPSLMRTLHKQGAHLLINPTGGDVVAKKWNDCLRTRAIENKCYTLCTMSGKFAKNNSSVNNVIGYDPYGNHIDFEVIYHSFNNYKIGDKIKKRRNCTSWYI